MEYLSTTLSNRNNQQVIEQSLNTYIKNDFSHFNPLQLSFRAYNYQKSIKSQENVLSTLRNSQR